MVALPGLFESNVSTIDADFLGPNAKYKVLTKDGQQYVGNASGQVFVIVTGSGKNIKYKVTSDLLEAQESYIKNFDGGLPALKKALLKSEYITQNEYDNNSYINGLVGAISELSIQNVQSYAYEGKTEFAPMSSFLSKQKAGTSTPKSFKVITTRADAKKELDGYLVDFLGRTSTPEEEKAYFAKLSAAEKKAVRTTSGGTTTGSNLNEADHLLIFADIAKASLKGTDAETLVTSGGRAATDIASLQSYASAYGVEMSAADALKYVSAGIGQAEYITKQKERIRQTSIVLHPQLKDHILAGGTVEDIANQYAYTKRQKLGVAVPVSTSDKDVMDAISRGISVNAFNKELQGKPEWRLTEEAQNIGADFTSTILQSFGFGG